MGFLRNLFGTAIFAASISVLVINLYTPEEIYTIVTDAAPSLKEYEFLKTVLLGPSKMAKSKQKPIKEILLTKEELSKYKGGKGSKGIYLALLGQVFDVSKGKDHYGPGGGYSFFSGIDGTRAFVSGDFTEKGLIEDVTGLSHQDMLGIEDWLKFYNKDYKYIGKVIGRYYDNQGNPTPALDKVEQMFAAAHAWKRAGEDERKLFPPCNSQWSQDKGGFVWCSDQSGGIKREWAGVPRKMYKPGSSDYRCVCVRTTGPPSDQPGAATNRGDLDNPHLQEYPDCNPTSERCPLDNK